VWLYLKQEMILSCVLMCTERVWIGEEIHLHHPPTHPSIYGSTALVGLAHFFSFLIYAQSVGLLGRGDQPVARPLPTHRTAETQNKWTDIHASSGIWIYDPSVRVGEDESCLILHGHCDWLTTNNSTLSLLNLFSLIFTWQHLSTTAIALPCLH
jgi:hypothetical protein